MKRVASVAAVLLAATPAMAKRTGATLPQSLLSIAFVAIALASNGCGEAEESSRGSTDDPGPIHVHGLGINPADDALFVAAHTGLFRAAEGDYEVERVANRYQDTMGFTIVGPNRFLGSGHPDGREKLPPFLGLIRSNDAGETWDPVSLLGKADFHVLESTGDLIFGYGSDFKTREQRLLVSADGGKSWTQRSLPEQASDPLLEESLLSIAIDPESSSTVIASGQEALWRSTDQGRHWSLLSEEPGLLAWTSPDELYLISPQGEVSTSSDEGQTWQGIGSIGGQPAAFEGSREVLLAALHDGTIKQSDDGGVTWTLRLPASS